MKFIAENPAAAGEMLAGHHGPDTTWPTSLRCCATARAIATTATHSARYPGRYARPADTDLTLSNNAVHAVIQASRVPGASATGQARADHDPRRPHPRLRVRRDGARRTGPAPAPADGHPRPDLRAGPRLPEDADRRRRDAWRRDADRRRPRRHDIYLSAAASTTRVRQPRGRAVGDGRAGDRRRQPRRREDCRRDERLRQVRPRASSSA